jgi:aminoglycoside 2'-N-acetyltransferase I
MARTGATEPDQRYPHPRLRRLSTTELAASELTVIRAIMLDAFGSDDDERFTDDDWEHAVGGVHFVLDIDGEVVAHAAVVERELQIAERPIRTGYVEAVATAPAHQNVGYGSLVMTDATAYVRERFELGALGTGRQRFYERLGWLTWRGPSSVRTAKGLLRTPDDDGYIMVLATPSTPRLDLTAPISCAWRQGDAW